MTRLQPEQILRLFVDSGALLSGHFQLSSGLHSAEYLQCALVLSDPARAEKIASALAELLKEPAQAVVSPALGGVVIGHEVARALGIKAYFAERENGIMTLRRGFVLKPREKVVIVEDVITTGKSSAEVLSLLKSLGADAVGALSIVNRSHAGPDLGVPLSSLLRLPIASSPADRCPQCRDKTPLVKPGSRPSS